MKMQRIIVVGQILTLTLMCFGLVRGLVDLGYLKPPWRHGGTATAGEVSTAGMSEVTTRGVVSRRVEKPEFFRQVGTACSNVWSKVTGAIFAVRHFCTVGWERVSGAWAALLGRTQGSTGERTLARAGVPQASPVFLPVKKLEMKRVRLIDESAARHTVRHSAGRVRQITTQGAAGSAR